ncbi:uncharacterized protein LOC120250682 isoform X2 [Dioscorea cayenensis subsp. rotundata]|uniref:Uncharacterized protein LOC120250682 isoform X2 n=1 Tax=Dioscorea cayennensis subsp. rotundata TaxID=55577 RepID=A0AB40AKS9_DIOCR|nr:uncharacterized protein LOC120250682 isoform X2 [Dioscorea cayenensis subsp. rotundata]
MASGHPENEVVSDPNSLQNENPSSGEAVSNAIIDVLLRLTLWRSPEGPGLRGEGGAPSLSPMAMATMPSSGPSSITTSMSLSISSRYLIVDIVIMRQ